MRIARWRQNRRVKRKSRAAKPFTRLANACLGTTSTQRAGISHTRECRLRPKGSRDCQPHRRGAAPIAEDRIVGQRYVSHRGGRLQAQALPFRWQLVGTSGLADVKPATWTAANLPLGVRDDWPATLPAAGHFSAFRRTSQRLNPADTKPFAPL